MLVGVASDKKNEEKIRKILEDMISCISYRSDYKVDKYLFLPWAIERVHLGVFDRQTQPYIFNINGQEIALFFDGKILSIKDFRDEEMDKKRDVELIAEQLRTCPLKKLLERTNGTFSGVMLNLTQSRLTLFNDKHGTRPLFYSFLSNELFFASEIKAWTNIEGFKKEMDWMAVMDLFRYGVDSQAWRGRKTLVKGIKMMPHATIIEHDIRNDKLTVDRYWDYKYKESSYRLANEKYLLSEFSRRIKKAVERCLNRMDGTIWMPLSGGLDSRLILAQVPPSHKKRIVCYTYTDHRKCIEEKIARKVAEVKGVKHVFIPFSYGEIGEYMKDAVWLSDEMNTVTAAYLTYVSNILTTRYSTSIVLTAIGGGEIFGGQLLQEVRDQRGGLFGTIMNGLGKSSKPDNHVLERIQKRFCVFTEEELAELFKPIAQKIKANKDGSIMPIKEKLASNTCLQYPENKIDYLFLTPLFINFLGTGIITRHWYEDIPVMFDDDLIDLYLEMPPTYRYADFRKKAMKKIDPALAKIPVITYGHVLTPITSPFLISLLFRGLSYLWNKLSHYVWVISLGKIDFREFLSIQWWSGTDVFLRRHLKYVKDVLLDEKTLSRPFLNGNYIKKLVSEFLEFKGKSADKIAILLTFELWNRMFFDETQDDVEFFDENN